MTGDVMEVLDYCHFPAENILQVWLSIYEKLGPDDKVTFSRACSEWHDWVARKRTTILFTQVAVFLLGRIPVSSLKQCRTVCRSWAQKIDSLHQYYPSHPLFEIGTEYADIGVVEDSVFSNEFGSADEIKRFIADMNEHPGNPLPSRRISLKCKIPEREDPVEPREIGRLRIQYWTAVTELLSKYGNYIHDVTFVFTEEEDESHGIEIVKHFRNCLLNLPNLQHLTMYSLETGLELEVEEYLRLNPLPRLQQLEAVDMHNAEDCLVEGFLNSCLVPAKVKAVWINPYRVPRVLHSFFNLESLTVRSSVFTIEDLERFRNLPQVPPLRILSVRFRSAMNALRVFTALEPFADTLTEVFIISQLNPVDGIHGIRVNLPRLEKLYLDSYQGSFDLFFGLTSLKKLRIDKPYISRGGRTNQVEQIREFERRLNESNIWERLPALKVIIVGRGDNIKFYYER